MIYNGYEYLLGSLPFAVISRIYLKVLTTLNPYIRKQSELGHTALIDTNLFSSQVAVPKMVPRREIKFPDRWQINQSVPVWPIVQQTLDEVIQTHGGNVYLTFKRPQRSLSGSMSSTSYRTAPSYRVD